MHACVYVRMHAFIHVRISPNISVNDRLSSVFSAVGVSRATDSPCCGGPGCRQLWNCRTAAPRADGGATASRHAPLIPASLLQALSLELCEGEILLILSKEDTERLLKRNIQQKKKKKKKNTKKQKQAKTKPKNNQTNKQKQTNNNKSNLAEVYHPIS